jgi:hypothetical protein
MDLDLKITFTGSPYPLWPLEGVISNTAKIKLAVIYIELSEKCQPRRSLERFSEIRT